MKMIKKPQTIAFLAGVLMTVLAVLGLRVISGTMLFPKWRCIQVLRTPDLEHVAKLHRLYGYIDVNFKITLDGNKIYHSRDCAPDASLPFRETLAWDASGKVLVFQLADQIVFAFDTALQRELYPGEFSALVLPVVTLDDIGFGGRHELKDMIQDNIQQSSSSDSNQNRSSIP